MGISQHSSSFSLVNSGRKRDAFSYLIAVWRVSKGIALPLWQHCSLLPVGCPTYSSPSRQVPGFLLQQNGTFPFDSCFLLPSLAHSGHLFSCSNSGNHLAGKPIPEIQNSSSEILQESFFWPKLQSNRRKQVLKTKVIHDAASHTHSDAVQYVAPVSEVCASRRRSSGFISRHLFSFLIIFLNKCTIFMQARSHLYILPK